MDFSRRRALRTIFCSSAFLSLNIRDGLAAEAVQPDDGLSAIGSDALHVLALGDYGTSGRDQRRVAKGMREFLTTTKIRPKAMMMLGDNFYASVKGGFSIDSERWKTSFEDVYPEEDFPCPCHVIFGNHDYHDNVGGQDVQLAYAKRGGTRWTIPHKWYRYEIGGDSPLLTVLAVDTNLPEVSGRSGRPSLSPAEAAAQDQWLAAELEKKRAPFTLVTGHHPLYSNGAHLDTKPLIKRWGELFQAKKVHAYLCGHDHDLQHLELEGLFTSFVLSGGGGANTRALKSPERSMPYGESTHGFTHLAIRPDSMVFSHHGADQRLLHRFSKQLDGSIRLG